MRLSFGSLVPLACLAVQPALAGPITGFAFTTLDDPDALAGTTDAYGINDAGVVTGWSTDAAGTHGFLYDGVTWTTLDNNPFPGGKGTQAFALNDSGQLLGGVYDASGVGHDALYDGTTWTLLGNADGASETRYEGINDAGLLAGFIGDAHGDHASLYDGTTYTTFDDPLSQGRTLGFGLNDAGMMTGYYYGPLLSTNSLIANHGFIFDGSNWTSFDAPDHTGLNDDPLATEDETKIGRAHV